MVTKAYRLFKSKVAIGQSRRAGGGGWLKNAVSESLKCISKKVNNHDYVRCKHYMEGLERN